MPGREMRLALLLGLVLAAAGPAFAAKPDAPGGAKPGKPPRAQPAASPAAAAPGASYDYFTDSLRIIIGDYYSRARTSGHCPPGLAKKNNGCLPPGQARKWRRGEYLPRDAEFYDLPAALIAELGRTPEGAKIVQAGAGILLVSTGTGLILDAMDIPQ